METNIQSKGFMLVKILNDKYVDSFKSGQLFMRRLKEFRDDEVNPARGDRCETLISTNPISGEFFLKQIYTGDDFERLKKMVTDVHFYDERCAYYNVFCMYSLEIDENENFIKPDKQLNEFNDKDKKEKQSAVIVFNSNEFMRRVYSAINKNFSKTQFCMADRVSYDIDFSQERTYYVFSKLPKYSYQNEFRICVDLYEGKMPLEVYNRYTDFAKLTMPPVEISDKVFKEFILDIGDISDICFSVPLEEFVEFKGIKEKIYERIK